MTRNKPTVVDSDKLKNLQPEDLLGLLTPLPRQQGTPDQMLDHCAVVLGVPVPGEIRRMVNNFAGLPVKLEAPKKRK